jgi:hypothetical protein
MSFGAALRSMRAVSAVNSASTLALPMRNANVPRDSGVLRRLRRPDRPTQFDRGARQAFGLQPLVMHRKGRRGVDHVHREDGGERRERRQNPQHRDPR